MDVENFEVGGAEVTLGGRTLDQVIPRRLRNRRVSFPLSNPERRERPKVIVVQDDSKGPAPMNETDSRETVHRRHSFHGMRSLAEHKFTMLHDLRAYFDATYRLNMVRERLREVAAEKNLTAEDMFSLVDSDGSGEIDAMELDAMVSLLGVRLKKIDLDTLMTLIDKSGNGECDVDEFRLWLNFHNKEITGRRRSPNDEYNDSNLLKRESLKFHPKMITVMDTWWKLVDSDQSGSISCEEYVKLHLNLQRAIVHQKDFDVAKARRLALQEWEFDSQGMREMDKNLFILSFFQMADAWRTGKIVVESYTGFMDMLQERMTFKREGSNQLHWAWEKDILWDVHLWEKKLEQKPKRITILQRAIQDARKNRKPKDLEDAMSTGGPVAIEHLKQFLPQELVEAAMRQKESRVQNRSWLDGSPNLQVRRRTAVIPAGVLPNSTGNSKKQHGRMTGIESADKSRKNYGDTVAWAERLYGTKSKTDGASGQRSLAQRKNKFQKPSNLHSGGRAPVPKTSILDVLDQVQPRTIDELDTDDDEEDDRSSATSQHEAQTGAEAAKQDPASQLSPFSSPIQQQQQQPNPRHPYPKGRSFSPQPIPQSDQPQQLFSYHHLRRPDTPEAKISEGNRPVTPVNLALVPEYDRSRPGTPDPSYALVQQYVGRPCTPGGRPWTPERQAIMQSMVVRDGAEVYALLPDEDSAGQVTRDLLPNGGAPGMAGAMGWTAPAPSNIWRAEDDMPPSPGHDLADAGSTLQAQYKAPRNEKEAVEPVLKPIRRSRLGHPDPWDAFEHSQALPEQQEVAADARGGGLSSSSSEGGLKAKWSERGQQNHPMMSPIVPRRRKRAEEADAARQGSELHALQTGSHSPKHHRSQPELHNKSDPTDTQARWAASQRLFQATGAIPPPSFFRHLEVGAGKTHLVMHGSRVSTPTHHSNLIEKQQPPPALPAGAVNERGARAARGARACREPSAYLVPTTEGDEAAPAPVQVLTTGGGSLKEKGHTPCPDPPAQDAEMGHVTSKVTRPPLPDMAARRGLFQGNAAFQHTTPLMAGVGHHHLDAPATREEMDELCGKRKSEHMRLTQKTLHPSQPRGVQEWSFGEEPWMTRTNKKHTEVLALAKQRPYSATSKSEALRMALMKSDSVSTAELPGPAHLPPTRGNTRSLLDLRDRYGNFRSWRKMARPQSAAAVHARPGLTVTGTSTSALPTARPVHTAPVTRNSRNVDAVQPSSPDITAVLGLDDRGAPASAGSVRLQQHVDRAEVLTPAAHSPFYSTLRPVQNVQVRNRTRMGRVRPSTAPLVR